MEGPMEALLTAIVIWLSTNYSLPASFDHPRVEFVTAEKIASVRHGNIGQEQQAGMLLNQSESDIVSLYNNDQRTIYLRDEWTGKTPADLSILVHEMVHHLQNSAHVTYECPGARERLAYPPQDKWLKLFGRDLTSEFDIDAFTLKVTTTSGF